MEQSETENIKKAINENIDSINNIYILSDLLVKTNDLIYAFNVFNYWVERQGILDTKEISERVMYITKKIVTKDHRYFTLDSLIKTGNFLQSKLITNEIIEEIFGEDLKKMSPEEKKEKMYRLKRPQTFIIAQIIKNGQEEEFLRKPEKFGKLDLEKRDIVGLIKATKNIEKYLDNPKLIEKFELPGEYIVDLIKETKNIEKYLDDPDKIKKFGIRNYDIEELIILTGNIEKYLDDPEKIKKFKLNIYNITGLITRTGNTEKYLNREKLEGLGIISESTISNLIIDMLDPERIKKYLNKEKLDMVGIKSDDIKVSLIISADKNEEYLSKKKLDEIGITSDDAKINLIIISKREDEYLNKEKLEGLGITSQDAIVTLIEAAERVKEYLNINKLEEIGITEEAKVKLILSNGEIEQYLDKEKLKNELGITSEESKIALIEATQNAEEYLNNKQLEKIGITSEESKIKLAEIVMKNILSSGNIEKALKNKELCSFLNMTDITKLNKIAKLIKKRHIRSNGTMVDKKNVNLPDEMTIGIEIESIKVINEELLRTIIEKTENRDWRTKSEPSLHDGEYGGIEVVSPILSGARAKKNERAIGNEIESVCKVLNTLGNYTNDTCGGHVHIGANYLKSTQAFINLLELWGNTEDIIYIIANEKGKIPREGTTRFAAPISRDLEKAIEEGSVNLDSTQDLKKFKRELLNFQELRYKGINFRSLVEYQTIEFRVPNGTINPEIWIENINLFGGVIRGAQEIAEIQEKMQKGGMLREDEKDILEKFENLKNEDLDDATKLELLLDIVIPDNENKEIYRARYKENSGLMTNSQKEELKSKIAKGTIKISLIDIKKAINAKNKDKIAKDKTEGKSGR